MVGSIDRHGGKWRPRYRDENGREHARHFDRKADARRWLDQATAAMVRGDHVDPRRSVLTVGDWSQVWMAGRSHLKPKTVAGYRSLLDTRVLPTWGRVRLGNVKHSAVATWVAAMRAEGLSASRTRQAYHVLTSMLDDAVKDGRLPRNPAAGVDLPRMPQGDRRTLTHDQLDDLADGCGPHRTFVLVLGYCGLRWGEAVALRVRRVDMTRGRLEVVESVADVGGRLTFGPPKTHQRREVVVPDFLRDDLAAQVEGKAPDALVFASRAGTPLRVQNFRRDRFDRATAAIGVPGLTPHELRHTAASLAIASGASIKGVQKMLGHRSAAMTLDRYGHLLGDELDAVAEKVSAARAESRQFRLVTGQEQKNLEAAAVCVRSADERGADEEDEN
jgi:integrase